MNQHPWTYLLLAGACACLVSCTENKPAGTENSRAAEMSAPFVQKTQYASANGSSNSSGVKPVTRPPQGADSGRSAASNNDMPVPPKDAEWTIFCDSVEGIGHVEKSQRLKDQLMKVKGLNQWYLIHSKNESTIYYGFYGAVDNAKHAGEKRRSESDRTRVQQLTDSIGNRLFRGCILVPLSAPDPVAPPEWNLANTPRSAFWSLQIMAFKDDPRRKEAAVDIVRQLREHGEMAYFYHGDTISSVCIGAWPREAVREQGTGFNKNGTVRDDAHTSDPSQPMMVLNQTLPKDFNADFRDSKGNKLKVIAPSLEIDDPTLQKAMDEHPNHATNYEVRGKRDTTGKIHPDPSFLVEIPHADLAMPGALDDPLANTRVAPQTEGAAAEMQEAKASGTGRLKSLSDR